MIVTVQEKQLFEQLLEWVIANKDWLFSGIGVAIATWIVRFLYMRGQKGPSQNIQSGENTTNIQAGRDVTYKSEPNRDDVKKK